VAAHVCAIAGCERYLVVGVTSRAGGNAWKDSAYRRPEQSFSWDQVHLLSRNLSFAYVPSRRADGARATRDKDLFRAMDVMVGTEKCHDLQLANHMAACGSNSASQRDDERGRRGNVIGTSLLQRHFISNLTASKPA